MNDSGGMGFLGFVLGGAVVVLAVIAFVAYGGQGTGPKTVKLELPAASASR
jgi:hypothetical protein